MEKHFIKGNNLKMLIPNVGYFLASYLKIRDAHFPSTTRCHLELLMHRCNNTCSRQKMIESVQRYFICRKAEISIYISDWIQWGIGTYQSVVEYIYCWNSGKPSVGPWQGGWLPAKKRKELIRHVKQNQKTRNLFNYTMRGQRRASP